MNSEERPVAYMVFAIIAVFERGTLLEYVEHILWISGGSALEAFDRASSNMSDYANICSEALNETRQFMGVSEVLPIWEMPSDGSRIGNRTLQKEDKEEIESEIMSRDEFRELLQERPDLLK